MKKIKNIIDNIVAKEYNEKVLPNILKVLYQININILKSLNDSFYKKVINIRNDYNKINLIEYQYFYTKKLNIKIYLMHSKRLYHHIY